VGGRRMRQTPHEVRTPLSVRDLPNPLQGRPAFVAILMKRWRHFESWPVEEQASERARICSTILLPRLAPKELAEIVWAVLTLSARGVSAGEHLVRAASGEIEFHRREAEIRKRGENPTFDRVLAEPLGEGPGYLGDAPSLSRGCRVLSSARSWGVHRKKTHDEAERLLGPALLGRPRRGLHPTLYVSEHAAVKEISTLLKNADRLIKGLSEPEAEKRIREKVWAYRRKTEPEPPDRERDFDTWTSHVPLRALGVDGDDTMGGMIETALLARLVLKARRWRRWRRGRVAWDLIAFAEHRGEWGPDSLKTSESFKAVLKDVSDKWTNLGVSARRRR
jgi:hypothetical protein